MKENYVTKKILEDARTQAAAIIKEAKAKATERVRNAKANLEQEEAYALEKAKIRAEQTALRQKVASEAETRRALAISKSQILDEVFSQVKCELSKGAKYDSLVANLVKKNANRGDEVRVSKQLPAELAEKLRLKQIIDKNIQGIILNNAKYELNLTLDEIIKNFRSHSESEIVKILWGS